ncbi:LuxR family transcriptional regulator [Methylocystis parvus]|uniref:LuxR family transcriptional regulator n=1 Tax=Methylocystis parvus TaxID=134 RepID=A0A6B8MCX4_9HYPH|nr:autoinducer binding domain-containing protein [Methylocystis parvus]QGM99163.1 LuxR family transcriptional regulator [Methylocystis parvus]WBK00463.1 autoinducer binding domain-containing protein [Methylocystis parvus OBBP]
MHPDDFFDLIDRLASSDRIDLASKIIDDFAKHWGLCNVAYAALNMPTPGAPRPLLSVTYSPEWQKHYAQNGYVDLDPIVRSGLGGILPIDWADIDRGDPIIRKFFGEAQELDVGSNGLSIPIRGRLGEFALFTITSNESPAEWRAMKRELLRDLMVVAFNFHAAALRSCGVAEETAVHLPLREASCLRWKALGKTDEEIGRILGITSHTVRFHLESARARLNTANTMHTVAKALALGLINMSYEPTHLIPKKRG